MNLEASLAKALAQTERGGVDLAHCPALRLGPLEVVPERRQLRAPSGESLVIQPLAMRVLLALAAQPGRTFSRDDLVDECWSQRIVGDDAVNRIISTLRRDLKRLSQDRVSIETIPKVGYRLRVIGREDGLPVGAAARPRWRRGWGRAWPAALLAAGALATTGFFLAKRPTDPPATAIAVIAENGGENGASARFADGLTGDLARLASTMASLSFLEPGSEPSRAPLLLRVALDPLPGNPSARVRLVDRAGGAVVWSREFEGEDGSIAELRERVANGVTGVLQCGLDRSAAFDDPVDLRLFLGACEGLETGDYDRARTFALQITESRPDAPAGWACLANTTIFRAANKDAVDDAVLAQAESFARRALAADPDSGLAYVALALASRWRGKPMLDVLERGIRADPDFAMLQKHYALALSDSGMVKAAVEPALRALALHPHDPGHHRLAISVLANAGRIEDALELSERARKLWHYDKGVAMQRLAMLVHEQDPRSALAKFARSPLRNEPPAQAIREVLAWRQDPGSYDWSRFDGMARRNHANNPNFAWRLAADAMRMGDQARGLYWLRQAPAEAYNGWWVLFAPEAAALRQNPEFFAKMAGVGMVRRWAASGRWPDFCSEPGLRYSCQEEARRLTTKIAEGKGGGRTRART